MAGEVFTSTIANQLKDTLDGVVLDPTDIMECMGDYFEEGSMRDAFVDDLEMGGMGLLSNKPDGTEIQAGTVREGFLQRYTALTLAGKLIITEEAMDDGKYPEAIDMGRHLLRAQKLTVEYDAALVLARATNTAYVGGDGVTLANTAHTLPNGGTWSNMFATAQSPSRVALSNGIAQLMGYPGEDGYLSPVMPKTVVHPKEQWATWKGILGSTLDPVDGNFARINAVKAEYDIKPVCVPYWSNTTTNWYIGTNAKRGLRFLWRKKPSKRTWVDNDHMVMKHARTMRYALGWTNARCMLFSNA